MTGYTDQEAIGQKVSLLKSGRHDQDFYASMWRKVHSDGNWQGEVWNRCKDGKVHPYWLTIAAVKGSNDVITHYVGTYQDISERKEAEEKLRASEERFRRLFELETDAVFLVDCTTGRFLEANDAAEKMYGYSHAELLALHAADVSAEPAKTRAAIGARKTELQIRMHRRKDGTEFPVEIAGSYFLAGGVQMHVAAIRDISERWRVERALLETQERLALAQRAANAGAWNWDMTTGKIVWTEEFFHLLGLDPAITEASLETWGSLLAPEDVEMAEARLNDAIRDRVPLFSEYRIIHPSGEQRWIQAFGETTYDVEGQPVRMSGICIDITEHKLMEIGLTSLRTEMEQILKWQVARQTAAALAHEINQPLASIAVLCEAASRMLAAERITSAEGGGQTVQFTQVVKRMATESERAGSVVRHLLESLSGPDATFAATSLAKMLDEAVRVAQSSGLDFEAIIDCPADMRPVRVNQLQVEKVLLNLIGNSVEARHEAQMPRGRVWISANMTADGAAACVSVRDEGPGISGEMERQIFHPFVSSKPYGMGMGLAICRTLVEAQGGKLWHQSHDGPGAIFCFTLPFSE